VIDGSKQFITNATTAGLFVVSARTAAATSTSPGIAVFLVPADAPGVGIGVKDAKMGQEGSRTADVSFAGVRVGADALIGSQGDRLPGKSDRWLASCVRGDGRAA
jgi:acyl-CoA dehydrogenase